MREADNQEADNQTAAHPCLRRVHDGYQALPARDCVPLSAPRRMRGIWTAGNELSLFAPENPDSDMRGEDIWLERDSTISAPLSGVFAVEFIGRRSRHRGNYGHLGMAPHIVVVDRMISRRRLSPTIY